MPATEPATIPDPKIAPSPSPGREAEPFTKPDRTSPPSEPNTNPDRIVVPCTPCGSYDEAKEDLSDISIKSPIVHKIRELK